MHIPRVFLFLVSGLLIGISFIFSSLFWCSFIGFALLLYAIEKEDSYRALFIGGFVTGTLHYAGSFYWVWSTYPIQWFVGQPYFIQLSAIGAYWVLTSLAMGISTGLFALVIKRIMPHAIALCAFVPIVWVLSEVFRSFLFSVYAFGEGSFFSVGFSYGYLGYLLAEIPFLLPLAMLAGAYVLSYVAALLGCTLYIAFTKRGGTRILIPACIAILIAASAYGAGVRLPTPLPLNTKVVVVEAWFDHAFLVSDTEGAQKNEEVKEAVQRALQENPDVIIMPEDVRFANAFETKETLFEWVGTHTLNREVIIIDNGPMIDARGKQVLRSFMYDVRTGSTYFFDKRYLVPQGEFMSYVHRGILSLFTSDETMENILDYARFEPGIISDSSAYPEYLPGVLFCFETMVPYGVRRAEHYRNPSFIAHPISHAWFTNPFSLESQLDEMLKVSAVWNRVPVVSAGSMTESKAFNVDGSVDTGELIDEGAHWKLRAFSL